MELRKLFEGIDDPMRKRRRRAVELPDVLPREVLDRVDRILDYHDASKHTYKSVRENVKELDWNIQPNRYRTFQGYPKIPLPTDMLDPSTSVLCLLADGVTALGNAETSVHPAQDLKTLATWLFLANGVTAERKLPGATFRMRTCPSSGGLYPFEIYVAAFGIEGVEPGLYHYDVQEFALRRLRDGRATFAQMRKGRPDLDFLKTVPAALLVSTVFCRSSWKFRRRAYRYALQDAGHLVQNLITVANGLGIATTTRLQMNDKSTRELIGLGDDTDFAEAEAVQAMVVWADQSTQPLQAGRLSAQALTKAMTVVPRMPLASKIVPYGSILAVHEDCTAPGVAVREVRPPLTELSPLASENVAVSLPIPGPTPLGPPLRKLLRNRRSATDFKRESIPRDYLWHISRLAFRGGTFFPMFPTGSHLALVRPFWSVHQVEGMDPGIWYYDAQPDRWHLIRGGDFRLEARYVSLEQRMCGHAAAVCFMVADFKELMLKAGPDTYRLAHLESGIAAQRIHLAAAALGVGCSGIGAFYDDEVKSLLELEGTGWQPVFEMALGMATTLRS